MKKFKQLAYLLCMIMNLLGSLKPVYGQESIEIVTSFYPMYALTETLVQDIHPVKMVNSQNGIHGFEPSAADIVTIIEADLFIYHSDILESWVKKLKRTLKEEDVQIIEAAEAIDMDRVQGLEHIDHIKGMSQESMQDPHTWMDPIEAAKEIQLIAQALSEIDPVNAGIYQERALAFTEEAQAIVAEFQPLFSQLDSKTFVTQHSAFSYLAKRFGLNQLSIAGLSNEIEPGSKQITETISFVKDNDVAVIFVEPGISPKPAEVIAAETGIRLARLSPLEVDPANDLSFIENLRMEIHALYQGLKE